VGIIKSAGALGILAGTLAAEGHVDMVNSLRAAAIAAGKSVYVILVGKLTPSKLANFHGVCDAFILVACPEASILSAQDLAHHPVPIGTPQEALIALEELAEEEEEEGGEGVSPTKSGSLSWDGSLVFSFQSLQQRLERSKAWRKVQKLKERHKSNSSGVNDSKCPTVLVHHSYGGQLKSSVEEQPLSPTSSLNPATSTTLAVSLSAENSALSLSSAGIGEASRRLLTRAWRGLAYEVDKETADSVHIAKGQTGVAAGYATELSNTSTS